MSRSYIIWSSLEDRIQESELLKIHPELLNPPLSWHFTEKDLDIDIRNNPFSIPSVTQNSIFRLLGEPLPWQIVTDGGEEWNLFGETIQTIRSNLHDLALGTGYQLPNPEDDEECWDEKEFNKTELEKFKEYWFTSMLEMIMSLSAYRSRDVMKWQNNQYEWVNSKWIRNVITACVHWDPKFFQYQEWKKWNIYSPYWNKVNFIPRNQIWAMTQVHHSHEPWFFATFFRYAYECWKLKDIIWENGEKFIKGADNLPWMLWNFWDAWSWSYMDSSEMMWRICVPIWWSKNYKNVHCEWFWPNYNGEKNSYYEFRTSEEWNLELFNAYTWTIDMIFYPEDCEDLLKWLLHQCAYWHGRTSKTQILNLVRYVYSTDFKEHVEDLGGLEMPEL